MLLHPCHWYSGCKASLPRRAPTDQSYASLQPEDSGKQRQPSCGSWFIPIGIMQLMAELSSLWMPVLLPPTLHRALWVHEKPLARCWPHSWLLLLAALCLFPYHKAIFTLWRTNRMEGSQRAAEGTEFSGVLGGLSTALQWARQDGQLPVPVPSFSCQNHIPSYEMGGME